MARIEHVAIFAADPEALKDFYIETFGLRVVQDNSQATPPGFFLADEAGAALEIIGRPADEPAVNTRYVCHVAFLVEDIDATKLALEDRGVVFERDSAVANDAMTTAFFLDPEGNRVQIVRRASPLVSGS